MDIIDKLRGKPKEPEVLPDEYDPKDNEDIPDDVREVGDDDIIDFVQERRKQQSKNIKTEVEHGEKVKPQKKAVPAQEKDAESVERNTKKEVQEAQDITSIHTSSISITVTEQNLEKAKTALDAFVDNGYTTVILAEKKESLFND